MHAYANEKHDHYLKIWAEFDTVEFAAGFMVGVFLILYYFVTAFDKSQQKQTSAGVTGMVISTAFYLGSAIFGLYPLYASAVFSVVVAFG